MDYFDYLHNHQINLTLGAYIAEDRKMSSAESEEVWLSGF